MRWTAMNTSKNAVAKHVIATLIERVRELEHEIDKHERAEWTGGMAELTTRVCDRKREQIACLNNAIRYIDQYLDI